DRLGEAQRRRSDVGWPRPRRPDPLPADRLGVRAERLQPQVRLRHLLGAADADARQPRFGRAAPAKVLLPAGGDEDCVAGGGRFGSTDSNAKSRPMTQLLEKALAEIRKRPESEQDAIAALILEELADERRWPRRSPARRINWRDSPQRRAKTFARR